MGNRFVAFLEGGNTDEFEKVAKKNIAQSMDRFANTFDDLHIAIEIPNLKELTAESIKLVEKSKLTEKKTEEKTSDTPTRLDAPSTAAVSVFTDKLLKIASAEILDKNGDIHPLIKKALGLSKENETPATKYQLIKGFARYIDSLIITSTDYQSTLAKCYESETRLEIYTAVATAIDQNLKRYKLERHLASIFPVDSPIYLYAGKDEQLTQSNTLDEYFIKTIEIAQINIIESVSKINIRLLKLDSKQPEAASNVYAQLDRQCNNLIVQVSKILVGSSSKSVIEILESLEKERVKAASLLVDNSWSFFSKPIDPDIKALNDAIKFFMVLAKNVVPLIQNPKPISNKPTD